MHYYQFNIGDYAKATRHLSNLEDLAYRRLMEIYYDTEKPLVNDLDKLARLINMRENKTEIEVVLSDFFILTDEGFSQKRIDEEIQNYNAKADTARVNGKKGGRPKKTNRNPEETEQEPRKTQSVILANPEETGSKANHKPITNNHKPITNNQLEKSNLPAKAGEPKLKRFVPPTLEEVTRYMGDYALSKQKTISPAEPEKFINFYESKGWLVGSKKMVSWQASARGWVGRIETNQPQQRSTKNGVDDNNWVDGLINGELL